MLIQLYRYGPSRQRIAKGFVVAGEAPEKVVETIKADQAGFSRDQPIQLQFDPRFPHAVYLDTRMVWLHTAAARERVLADLQQAIVRLVERVQGAGGAIVPNAVHPTGNGTWECFLCGDRHFLQTHSDVEKEVYCNLLRAQMPILIGLTGRAGLDPRGVEPLGSRRLSDSRQHFAARYLHSVTPHHVARVEQCLRRDAGVSRLNVLDVNPLGDPQDDGSSVELRFTDGQTLLSSVRAQAILFQALLLRARRTVRMGRRIGDSPRSQHRLELNRARAITKGLQARFELEPPRQRGKKNGKTRKGRDRQPPRTNSGDALLLETLEDLRIEFQVLEVEYPEIAPLVLGTSLRQMGLPGLRTENDLFRVLCTQPSWNDGDLAHNVGGLFSGERAHHVDHLTQRNEERHPHPADMVRRWWTMILQSDPQEPSKKKDSKP